MSDQVLADARELRGAPATLLFRHLRDDAVAVRGGAAVSAFMRLGNHQEAGQPRRAFPSCHCGG